MSSSSHLLNAKFPSSAAHCGPIPPEEAIMANDRWESDFDEARWAEFGRQSIVPGGSVQWDYSFVTDLHGLYGDYIRLSPILRIRRFSDSVEVVAGAKAVQFDSDNRPEGEAVLSYAEMDMITGRLCWNSATQDGPHANQFTMTTQHGFNVYWSEKWNSGTVCIALQTSRRVTVKRGELNDAFAAIQDFIRDISDHE
ncbi:MAG: hypothetical protein AB8G99_09010 [Planctomycetaceae bacterium]